MPFDLLDPAFPPGWNTMPASTRLGDDDRLEFFDRLVKTVIDHEIVEVSNLPDFERGRSNPQGEFLRADLSPSLNPLNQIG